MLFHSVGKERKSEIEALFHEVQINLENNYKDLAIGARKQAEEKLRAYEASGELKGKDLEKLKTKLAEYTKRMEGYHH